jgi:uncharacterized membrane-anchored protein
MPSGEVKYLKPLLSTRFMAEEEDKEKGIAPACRGCLRWEHFGKNCFYFWEGKKNCSMFTTSPEEL